MRKDWLRDGDEDEAEPRAGATEHGAAWGIGRVAHGVILRYDEAMNHVHPVWKSTLEIIGEAVRHVSDTFRTAHPDVPWSSIIGQRNILDHEYGAIDPALMGSKSGLL